MLIDKLSGGLTFLNYNFLEILAIKAIINFIYF